MCAQRGKRVGNRPAQNQSLEGKNYHYRNSAFTRTLTIAHGIHNFLRPGTFCRLCLATAADQRSYIYIYIYNICIYLYNLLLRKSGWNSFRTLAHVRTKAHFLVRAFTGLLHIHSNEALSHHGWLLRQQDRKDALLFRWSKECLRALFGFPAFFYLRTKRHNKITLHFFGTFSCSFKQEGKVAAAETKHRSWKKVQRKKSQRHTTAATQPHPVLNCFATRP